MKTNDIDTKPPSAWIPETDPVKIAILGKSIEEASELVKILARCIVQGIEQSNPDTEEPNREELADELDDVETMIHIIRTHFNVPSSKDRQRKKANYQSRWYEMLEMQETES